MKILNFILAAMFLVFASLQVNDPDPFIWITIYGVMAVLAVFAMFNVFPAKIILILIILYAAYSVVYFPGVKEWLHTNNKGELFDNIAKMNHLYIEESREFLGLWICILVLVFYYIRSRRLKITS